MKTCESRFTSDPGSQVCISKKTIRHLLWNMQDRDLSTTDKELSSKQASEVQY